MKNNKEFTEQDLIDAVWAGINYAHRIAMNGFSDLLKGNIMPNTDENESVKKLIENVLKDKRGIPRI